MVAKDPKLAYRYAIEIIKGRWPEAEKVIATDSGRAYLYARDVIKGRWPEAEKVIATDSVRAYNYARDILHDKDPGTWAKRYKARHNISEAMNLYKYAKNPEKLPGYERRHELVPELAYEKLTSGEK